MIEAPEAFSLATQLEQTVKGKIVTEVLAGHTPHKFTWFNPKPEQFPAALCGKRITGARAYGGHIAITVGDMTLLLSEGINLNYIAPGGKLPSKHQLLLGFGDESCLVVSVRMYGGIHCAQDGKVEGGLQPYYEAARDKPQVLSDDFTKEYFMELLRATGADKKSAKAMLATEQTIPGLGNGVLQDILYNARIHPKTKISALDAGQKSALYDYVKNTLAEMARAGGRSSESGLSGNPGGYVPFLSKDTLGQECTRCGAIIVKESYMGGAVYYCPGCQKQTK